MSCSKWRWTPACDAQVCVGDCDECGFDPDEEVVSLRQENAELRWQLLQARPSQAVS